MPVSFPVQVSDFPGQSQWDQLNGLRREEFRWGDFLRAAMMAGYLDQFSIPSPQFALWRAATIRLALRHQGNFLIRAPEWGELDPSEKGAVTSVLGTVVTKLLMERLLGAPIFLFLDVHFITDPQQSAFGIRPDFLAMTPKLGWFSVEAKGRAQFRRSTLQIAKEQATAVGTVDNSPVLTGIACVTSFRHGFLQARFADPPARDPNLIHVRLEAGEALSRYYQRFFEFRQYAEEEPHTEVGRRQPRILRYSQMLDADIGLTPEISRPLAEGDVRGVQEVLQKLQTYVGAPADPPDYPGPDGIIIIPGGSWREER